MNSASRAVGLGEARAAPVVHRIPFDYVFSYVLKGTPDNVLKDVVIVSIEGAFVAVSIGYGMIPKKPSPLPDTSKLNLFPSRQAPVALSSISVADIVDFFKQVYPEAFVDEGGPEAVLRLGFRLDPEIAESALGTLRPVVPLADSLQRRLFQPIAAPTKQVQFKYALFDAGSGREFQSEPILSTAGLGASDGGRPFRYFAEPITFAPRSTIRLEVTEVSEFKGDLHIVLHGYKALGASSEAGARPGVGASGARRWKR